MTSWPKVFLKLAESAKDSAGVSRGPQWLASPARASSGSSCLLEKFRIFDAILTRPFWWRFCHHLENHVSRSSTLAYVNAASWMRCSGHRWLSSNWSRLKEASRTHLCSPFCSLLIFLPFSWAILMILRILVGGIDILVGVRPMLMVLVSRM